MFVETATVVGVVALVFSGLFTNTAVLWWRIGRLEGKVDALIRAKDCREEDHGN